MALNIPDKFTNDKARGRQLRAALPKAALVLCLATGVTSANSPSPSGFQEPVQDAIPKVDQDPKERQALESLPAEKEENPQSREHLQRQRLQYRAALDALKDNDNDTFIRIKRELLTYSLYPYLEYEFLKRQHYAAVRKQLDIFFQHHDEVPVSRSLRLRLLEQLYQRKEWSAYKNYHRKNLTGAEQQCRFQEALYHTGSEQEAIANGLKLWNVGRSQVSSCDPLFKLLIDSGSIVEELVWQRYTKAVLAHRYDLARYVQRFLKSSRYISLARRYVSLDRNYQLLGNRDLFSERTPEISAVIAHAILHQSADNPRLAEANWKYYQSRYAFDAKTRAEIYTTLARAFYKSGDAVAFASIINGQSELLNIDFHEWRLRQLIGEGNWPSLLAGIKTLPLELQNQARWQYWQARASLLLGDNGSSITQTFRTLAQKRSYYGFLASDWLAENYQMEHRPAAVNEDDIHDLIGTPAMTRIRELRYHQQLPEALREWRDATRAMNEAQLLVAAQLAKRWRWHHQSIFAMIKASYWDDIDTRFPVLYREYFQAHSGDRQLPMHLMMALARQESAYHDRAVSPAGARGLMQLMPATARETARKHSIPYTSKNELFIPEKNIRLGTQYYRDMLKRFDDNRILATAAYNAGPHRVDRWLSKSKGQLPFDAWIETIPFKETRNYVQNVLAFSAIYAHHLGEKDRILTPRERDRTL